MQLENQPRAIRYVIKTGPLVLPVKEKKSNQNREAKFGLLVSKHFKLL